MQKETWINLRSLAAMAPAMSTGETRYYLNGVLLECEAEHVTYVATDGHMLAATRDPSVCADGGEFTATLIGESLIVPAELVRAIKLKKHEMEWAKLVKREDDDARRYHLERHDGSAVSFLAIDGTFPDWRRVVPRKYDGAPAHFDVSLLARAVKIKKALGCSFENELDFTHNGDDPALVSFGLNAPNAFAVIMPYRGIDAMLPEWAATPSAPPTKRSPAR